MEIMSVLSHRVITRIKLDKDKMFKIIYIWKNMTLLKTAKLLKRSRDERKILCLS